ncbi:MAG: hypothetical protein AAF447_03080 [Myxococcota bacterium]
MRARLSLHAALLVLAACGLEQGSGRPCTLDAECARGEACDVGLGLCVVACDPVGASADGCAEGFGCRLRTVDEAAGVCRLNAGITQDIGQPCSSTAECPFGALCGSGLCLELCQVTGGRESCPTPASCVNVEPLSARFGVCLR